MRPVGGDLPDRYLDALVVKVCDGHQIRNRAASVHPAVVGRRIEVLADLHRCGRSAMAAL